MEDNEMKTKKIKLQIGMLSLFFFLGGWVMAGTTVTIKSSGTEGQAARAVTGTIDIQDPPVPGALVAEGNITLGSNAITNSYVGGVHTSLGGNGNASAGGSFSLDSDAIVNGEGHSQGTMTVAGNSTIIGDASSGSNIAITGSANQIQGDAEADGTIIPAGRVTGTPSPTNDVDNSISLPSLSFPSDLPSALVAAGTGVDLGDIDNSDDGTTFTGGHFNNFNFSATQVTFNGGNYWFDGFFTIDSSAILNITADTNIYINGIWTLLSNMQIINFDGTNNYQLDIYINGNVLFGSNGKVNMYDPTPGDTGDLQNDLPGDPAKCNIRCASSAASTVTSNYIMSAVMEFNGDITYDSNAIHFGSVTSNDGNITVNSNAKFLWDERLGSTPALPEVTLEHEIETKP